MKKKTPQKDTPKGSANGEPKEKPDQEFEHETPHQHQNEEAVPRKNSLMTPCNERQPQGRYSPDSGRSL